MLTGEVVDESPIIDRGRKRWLIDNYLNGVSIRYNSKFYMGLEGSRRLVLLGPTPDASEVAVLTQEMLVDLGPRISTMGADAIFGVMSLGGEVHLVVATESHSVSHLHTSDFGGPSFIRAPPDAPSTEAERKRLIHTVTQSRIIPIVKAQQAGTTAPNICCSTTRVLQNTDVDPDMVSDIERMLETGFYYSYDWDFTRSFQYKVLAKRQDIPQGPPCANDTNPPFMDVADDTFVWNKGLVRYMVDPRWFIPLVQGSVNSASVTSSTDCLEVLLICRRGHAGGGTRYHSRGVVNPQAEVANFCESECAICIQTVDKRSSLVRRVPSTAVLGGGWSTLLQIRGSVPVLWKQSPGNRVSRLNPNPPVRLMGSEKQNAAFYNLHQRYLVTRYGSPVVYANLLSPMKAGEKRLSDCMLEQFQIFKKKEDFDIRLSAFDFHHLLKESGLDLALENMVNDLSMNLEQIGYFSERPHLTVGNMQFQDGVIRTNCLDCLDRTNGLQWYIAWRWIKEYVSERGLLTLLRGGMRHKDRVDGLHMSASTGNLTQLASVKRRLGTTYFGPTGGFITQSFMALNTDVIDPQRTDDPQMDVSSCLLKDIVARLWADQGDMVSTCYTGTGSVLSGLIKEGRRTLQTNVDHVFRSIGRAYQNTFEDYKRQEGIDLFLGHSTLSYYDQMSQPSESHSPVIMSEPEDSEPADLSRRVRRFNSKDSDGLDVRSRTEKPRPVEVDRRTRIETSASPSSDSPEEANVSVWVGTWNVAGRQSPEELHLWIPSSGNDIVVVCLQEAVGSVRALMSAQDISKANSFETALRHHLGPDFGVLRSMTMIGLMMIVLVHRRILPHVTHVMTSELKLGWNGNLGNKGALFTRLRIGSRTLCLVNVHLTAGPGRHLDRKVQIEAVLRHRVDTRSSGTTADHDIVLIAGDFNFRVAESTIQRHTLDDIIKQKRFHELFEFDEFLLLRKNRTEPFQILLEGPVHFNPSYKYVRGGGMLDRSRCPSWCDRIVLSGSAIHGGDAAQIVRLVDYNSVDACVMSDHKPVYGIYKMSLPLDPKPGVDIEIKNYIVEPLLDFD